MCLLVIVPVKTGSHASTYELDSDGFMLVTVQATGVSCTGRTHWSFAMVP